VRSPIAAGHGGPGAERAETANADSVLGRVGERAPDGAPEMLISFRHSYSAPNIS